MCNPTKYKINHNVRLPEDEAYRGIYPFPFMRKGDSFEVSKRHYAAVRSAACAYQKKYNPKSSWTIRTMGDTTARIWRTA